jgi:enoyl-CoA hydratase
LLNPESKMTSSDKILVDKQGPLGFLTFNNPERHNAMSLDMWRQAAAELVIFGADPDIRAVILNGAGGKAFVSGADISKFDDERATAKAVNEYGEAVEALCDALIDYEKPTLAMIQGYCIGGGLNIAVCCDLRYCNQNARFGIPAAKLGIGYPPAAVRRLLNLIGPQFVREMLFTARHFDAVAAARIGLINGILEDSEIELVVRNTATQIADNAPLSLRAAKMAIREILKDSNNQDLSLCDREVKNCFDSEDYREGRRAFMEKRKPDFKGK